MTPSYSYNFEDVFLGVLFSAIISVIQERVLNKNFIGV